MGDEGAQVRVNAIPRCAVARPRAGYRWRARGRIVEVFGPESSGKTTLIYHVLAEAQKLGGVCVHRRRARWTRCTRGRSASTSTSCSSPSPTMASRARDRRHARALGRGRCGGHRLGGRTHAARRLEGQMGDQTVGLQARMMSQAMRKLAGNLNRTQTLCIFTNQIREKVGVMFGSPETQPGGRAEVLRRSVWTSAASRPQGGHRGGRQPRARQGGQEQGRRAVPPGRVRHRVRQGLLHVGLPDRPGHRAQRGHRRARSSPATSALGQGAQQRQAYLDEHVEVAKRSRPRSTRRWASIATSSSRSIPTPSPCPTTRR